MPENPNGTGDVTIKASEAIDRVIILQAALEEKAKIIQDVIDRLNNFRSKGGLVVNLAGDQCTPDECIALIARLEEKATNA